MTLRQSMKKEHKFRPFSLDIIFKQNLNIYIVFFYKYLSELYWVVVHVFLKEIHFFA